MSFYKFMGVSEIFKLRGGVPQPVTVIEARGGANVDGSGGGGALAEAFPPRPETKLANQQQQTQHPCTATELCPELFHFFLC